MHNDSFRLGVLGGGQLGRMMIQSAIDYNIDVHVLDPNPNAPCSSLAASFRQGDLNDYDTVVAFGSSCTVLTIEIENVNTDALFYLQKQGVKVFPQPEVIALIQDKREQKQFYEKHELPTAPFELIDSRDQLHNYLDWLPAVHKLGRGGYDGRGVQMLNSADDIAKSFDAPSLLERKVDFEKEIAVIVARSESGEIATYPAVEMVFHPTANLVLFQRSPAELSNSLQQQAQKLAHDIAEKIEIVGLLAVELFVTKDGALLVNEVAPRTHNSGHQSIEGNVTSQFEQHLRAILDLPLGSTAITKATAMVNILGAEGHTGHARYEGLKEVMAMDGTHIHLYGKKITKPFRKMGHVTIEAENASLLEATAEKVMATLKVVSE